MNLNLTFRHFDSSDALKSYTQEKVNRAHKYLERDGEAHVVLSLERHLHHADITIQSGTYLLRGREKTEDMYASIDGAMDKIEKQLKRYKEKLKHHHGRDRVHHRKDLVERRARHAILQVPEPETSTNHVLPQHTVVRTNEFLLHPMSIEEAAMQMDLMNNDFYVFTNSTSMEMNVVYRRADGTIGLIEASAAPRRLDLNGSAAAETAH